MNVQRLKDGNPHLIEIIRSKIAVDGPVPFAWFMEHALYHPDHGYYSSGRAKLGRRGDFFTNVSVGSMFGKLLAAQFNEVWEQLGNPADFRIVEQGAHDGTLARDILSATARLWPNCLANTRYCIVEPFPVLRNYQTKTLAEFAERTGWRASLDELEPFTGICFSNELVDAMPVHLITRNERGAERDWSEQYVDWQHDGFRTIQGPISDRRLETYLEGRFEVPAGATVEVNLAALDWIGELASKLQRGYIVTTDYGFLRGQDSTSTAAASLQCRSQHKIVESPFQHIGNCDMTTHVDWAALAEHARGRDLRLAGFTDQYHFITGIVSEYLDIISPEDSAGRRQLQTLLHPEIMGRSFQVLGLSRRIGEDINLCGFKFARPAHDQLGIDKSADN